MFMMGSWDAVMLFTGTALLIMSSSAHAFVPACLVPSGYMTPNLQVPQRGTIHPQRGSHAWGALRMCDQEVVYDENGDINQDHVLDEYQKNPKGLAEGEVVTVMAKGLKFYHVRKFKDEGLDPEGMVGTIRQLKLRSDKWDGEDGLVTANRPVFVQFLTPVKFRAHFEFGEVRRPTPEELDMFRKEEEAQNSAKAAANAKLEEERAAKRAE